MAPVKSLMIELEGGGTVSALLSLPSSPRACFVFAHGAGAGMTHRFMEAVATGLTGRDIATLRYQFPYRLKGNKRPDAPVTAHGAVRAAVREAARRYPRVPLIAGGKSFGGRMTSQAQAIGPLAAVAGLAFFGFPLHPAGKPSDTRAEHLVQIRIPMLFLQGTRDALADLSILEPLAKKLGENTTLRLFDQADHSFHVPVRSGKNDAAVLDEMLDAFRAWSLKITRP